MAVAWSQRLLSPCCQFPCGPRGFIGNHLFNLEMESPIAQVGFGFHVVMDELELQVARITGVHHNNGF